MAVNISPEALKKLTEKPPPRPGKVQKPPKKVYGPSKFRAPHPRKAKSAVSGLGTNQWFETIFKSNEAYPKNKKLTDIAILDEWERQFGAKWPKVGMKRKQFMEMRMNKLREYRKRWNRGELYATQRVTVLAWRYDCRGVRVDFSDGVTPMTPAEMFEWIQYFKERAGTKWAVRT